MKKLLLPSTLALVFLSFAMRAPDHNDRFRARLKGSNEVPPVQTDTTGRADFRYNDDEGTIDFRLRLRDARRITQAHIHHGGPDENGPVILFLAGFHDRGWDVDGEFIRATLTEENIVNDSAGDTIAEIVDEIRAGNTYVNVHSVANPPGEVRGQLR